MAENLHIPKFNTALLWILNTPAEYEFGEIKGC